MPLVELVHGPQTSAAGVRFGVPDEHGHYDGVRLELDWQVPGLTTDFTRVPGGWSLWIDRPPVQRMEYRFTLRHGTEYHWTLDWMNPFRVPGPFGERSEIQFPGYHQPDWMAEPNAGSLAQLWLPTGTWTEPVPVLLWAAEGLSAETPAPLVIAHDGSDLADRGSLLHWASRQARLTGPLRVALLDPAAGRRDVWYSANPEYADHLATLLIPRLRELGATSTVIGLGCSLGALALLHLQRRHPGTFAGLALQSGSFFTHELDGQESGYEAFDGICSAVREIQTRPTDEVVPLYVSCGAVEENLANNELMAEALGEQGYPIDWLLSPDAHTLIGWRDAWSPGLENLIGRAK